MWSISGTAYHGKVTGGIVRDCGMHLSTRICLCGGGGICYPGPLITEAHPVLIQSAAAASKIVRGALCKKLSHGCCSWGANVTAFF